MGPATTGLNESYPADAASVRVARQDLTEFAADAGAPVERLDEIRLAASEALTNAVIHGYGEEPGTIYLTAAMVAGELWVLICDDGSGLSARTANPGLGLGLTLIAHACDDFTIVPRATGGTEVRMRFDLFSAKTPANRDERRASNRRLGESATPAAHRSPSRYSPAT
jgi:stage II sporulation protein AB (anti-sigma F factor)